MHSRRFSTWLDLAIMNGLDAVQNLEKDRWTSARRCSGLPAATAGHYTSRVGAVGLHSMLSVPMLFMHSIFCCCALLFDSTGPLLAQPATAWLRLALVCPRLGSLCRCTATTFSSSPRC